MRTNLTLEDVGDLLERPILAVLATHRKDGTILLSPVWHEWTDGGFSMAVWANDIKARNVRRDPRATVLVADQNAPYAGVEVRGEATVAKSADLMPMVRRCALRYVGGAAGAAYADSFEGVDLELIRLEPGRIRIWDFKDDLKDHG